VVIFLTIAFMLPFAALNQDKTQLAHFAHNLGPQLLIAQMIKLARTANLRALDALAGQNAFFFQRRHCGPVLMAMHRTRQYCFCLIHQAFGGHGIISLSLLGGVPGVEGYDRGTAHVRF